MPSHKARSARTASLPPEPGRRSRLLRVGLLGCGLLALVMAGCYHWISWQGRQGLYLAPDDVPHRSYALVLGTAPTAAGGWPNAYFVSRIEAAAALWRAGKYEFIIASGSRRTGKDWVYDEIAAMRKALIAAGVPAERILADPDAHDTRLSIEHAESRFGLRDYLIVSQRFHCERALFIAHDLGQTPVCYGAPDLRRRYLMLARETLSRCAAVLEALIK